MKLNFFVFRMCTSYPKVRHDAKKKEVGPPTAFEKMALPYSYLLVDHDVLITASMKED